MALADTSDTKPRLCCVIVSAAELSRPLVSRWPLSALGLGSNERTGEWRQ
jgi:hypothetical protein